MARRKRGQRLGPFQIGERIRRRGGRRRSLQKLIELDLRMCRLLPNPSTQKIPSDAVQVDLQGSTFGIETSAALHQRDEYLLRDVFGRIGGSAHLSDETIDRALISAK